MDSIKKQLITLNSKIRQQMDQNLAGLYIQQANLKITGFIGKGNFGSVYKAQKQGKIYAVKQQLLYKYKQQNKGLTKKVLDLYQQQYQNILKCNSQYIIKCYQIYQNDDIRLLLLQYCNGGTLKEYQISGSYEQKEQECLKLLAQLIQGICEIHRLKIIHRDLKQQNIMLNDGKIKIIDLGLSRQLNANDHTTTNAGDQLYKAPQVYSGKYNCKVDIWSLGVIIYKMLFQTHPFHIPQELTVQYKTKVDHCLQKNKGIQKSVIQNYFIGILIKQSLQKQSYQKIKILKNQPNYSSQIRDLLSHLIDPKPQDRYGWQQLSTLITPQMEMDIEHNYFFQQQWVNQQSTMILQQ